MRKALFDSIQSRLLFSFLMSAIFAIILVGIFNLWIRQQLVDEADARLLATAHNVAGTIEQFNTRNIQTLEMAARLPQLEAFIDATEVLRANPDFRDTTLDTLASMQPEPWNQFYTLSFGILDIDGINILDTTSSNIGQDESAMPYFRQPLVTGLRLTSDLYFLNSRTGVYYYYIVPIRRKTAPNPVIGLIRAEVSISAIQDLLLSLAIEPEYSDLNLMLFDEQMVRLVDSENPDTVFRSIRDYAAMDMNELIAAQRLPNMRASYLIQPVPKLLQELAELRDAEVFTSVTLPNEQNEQRIAALRLDAPNWLLAVGKTTELFYLPIQRQTEGLFLLSFLLMTGAVGISLLISRSVTVPIRQLTTVAQEVAAGNLTIQAPVRSQDEIGTLAETFNQMTAELLHIKSNLEHLVEERTQSLKETNASLTHAMSERERLEAQNLHMALEAERTRILSEFIQDASHEFKTPLSIINVKTHLLRRVSEEKLQRHLGDIELQSQNIEALVNAMVLMAKLDSTNDLALSPSYVDDFLKSVYERENTRFEQFQVLLHLELHGRAASFAINAEMMREALRCILDNARTFTPAGGMVIIQSESDPLFVEIRVQDTGLGMNANVMQRAFERFYRGDEAHTTRGFGLGLPIAKRIIELSAGQIRIESHAMEGTTVIIRLPRSAEIPQAAKRMS